ncbi:MAG TPA: sn-glycerol-3-phosphate ABC transporter ATP-binding protein UgpC [Pyrinomonadaceae bacterium]|nr:sn-glycerol-3-phosphate ABC transporter ATP-binding protein UgpC [Pyrinomonadaceae bacterium]
MASLQLKDVSKIYPGNVRAIAPTTFDVNDGEFIVLVGPSGCGKSTLLRVIAGLETASQGEILIDGKLVNNVPAKDRDIAMVFQNYALYPHMTVYDNMAFSLKMRGFAKAEIDNRVTQAADVLGLRNLLHRRPKALSGGQRQRVAVGRAIVRQPKLFLFDEPLSNLDAKLRVSMRAELIRLHKRLKATMVYVTHDQVEAMSMGDRLVVLKEGVVQQIGKPLEIYDHPANQFVAGFIGSPPMNFFSCKTLARDGDLLLLGDGLQLKLPAQKRGALGNSTDNHNVILGIRPENIFERASYQGATDDSVIRVRVEVLEPLGSDVLATCSLADRELIVRLNSRTPARIDEPLELVIDMERTSLFDPNTGEALL